jgi:hypothetical protein
LPGAYIDVDGSMWTTSTTIPTDPDPSTSFTIVANEPSLSAAQYDFIVVDESDYAKAQPFSTARSARITNFPIVAYSEPIENAVHIVVKPTPSDSTVTIDSIPTKNVDVSVGDTILVKVSKYGYVAYNEAITIDSKYLGQTVSIEPVLEACGVTEPYCTGYVAPEPTTTTDGCDSGDLLCQYKAYLPYAAIGAVIIFMMMQNPRSSNQSQSPAYRG